MTPLLKKDNQRVSLHRTGYYSEAELQETLADNPELLCEGSDALLKTVCREVMMEGQRLDILMVDTTGLPVAVEVKLIKNPNIRREVVGQALEYASLLSSLTIDELDSITQGKLIDTLRDCDDEETFEERRRDCATHLRAGQVRVVIAVDDAPESLIRTVAFLSRRSDLDVRLVTLEKYPIDTGEVFLVPKFLVKPEGVQPQRPVDPWLLPVILDYERLAPEECPIWDDGEPDWRQVCPGSWKPTGVHYEFCSWNKVVSIEIHLEEDPVLPLQDVLAAMMDDLAAKLPGSTLDWDTEWGLGIRLGFLYPKGTPSGVIAEGMRVLIQETITPIQEYLDQNCS